MTENQNESEPGKLIDHDGIRAKADEDLGTFYEGASGLALDTLFMALGRLLPVAVILVVVVWGLRVLIRFIHWLF